MGGARCSCVRRAPLNLKPWNQNRYHQAVKTQSPGITSLLKLVVKPTATDTTVSLARKRKKSRQTLTSQTTVLKATMIGLRRSQGIGGLGNLINLR